MRDFENVNVVVKNLKDKSYENKRIKRDIG